jgi:hypothetical protein
VSFSITDARGQTFAEVEMVRIGGRPGLGFYRLVTDWRFDARGIPPQGAEHAWLESLEFEVLAPNIPLGRMRVRPGQSRIETTPHGPQRTQLVYEMDLTPLQIEALEGARMGRNLDLQMNVHGSISLDEIRWFPINQVFPQSVTQSDWTRVLGEMQYRQTVLIELDATLNLPPQFKGALDTLRTVERKIWQGELQEAVRECRLLLDRIGAALNDVSAPTHDDPFKRSKHERYLEVRRAVFNLVSPAHHGDATADSIEWHRSDALAVLAVVSGLLRALEAADARAN